MNDEEQNLPQNPQVPPDPAKSSAPPPPPKADLTREQIIRRCQKYGIQKDELDTLYPDDKALQEFYDQVRSAGSLDDSDPSDPKDSYKLSESEKTELRNVELLDKRKAQAKLSEDKQRFEAAGAHLPTPDKVSWEEAQQAMRDALSARRASLAKPIADEPKPKKKAKKVSVKSKKKGTK
jgi:hypothetical protein